MANSSKLDSEQRTVNTMDNYKTFYRVLRFCYYFKKLATMVVHISVLLIGGYGVALWLQYSKNFDVQTGSTLVPVLGLIFIFFTIATNRIFGFYPQSIETNNSVDVRRNKICDLLSKSDEELTLVSGSYFKDVYDSEQVLKCFDALPKSVNINAFIEKRDGDDDAEKHVDAKKFLSRLKERGVKVRYVRLGTPHTIIVDGQGTRIELDPGKPDDAPRKRALIFKNSSRIASAMTQLVERNREL